MDRLPSLRFKKKTIRRRGRRAITPMRRKVRHAVNKTRSAHKVDNGVPLYQRSDAYGPGKGPQQRKDTDGEHQGQKGDENSDSEGEWCHEEIHETTDLSGNQLYSTLPVHPGSVSELRELSADCARPNAAKLQEEETYISFLDD